MLKKKVTMLGAFAVGKTSLVQRFVHSIFSEKYQTTIGVKIDQKNLNIANKDITLMLWDLFGQDDFMKIKASYLIGSSGFILVADGTRKETLLVAKELHELARQHAGNIPFILLVNKTDLVERWEIDEVELEQLEKIGWKVLRTSAKDGSMVEEAFHWLASQMI
jgi:hypothetical protein